MRRFRFALRLLLVLFALFAPTVGPHLAWAVNPFEIQVYDGLTNRPGAMGLEAHLNHVANGVRTADAPELPAHRQSHLTFEPSLGLTRFWELGGYLQTAVRADGTYDYAGVKLRSKFTMSPARSWRLGINLELSNLPEAYDRYRWGAEVRPIVAWETKYTLLAFNPIVERSRAFSFEPAAQALFLLPEAFGLGFEYYGSTEGDHYLYEVVNLLADENIELQAGVGEGLTTESNPLVFKVIVGVTFDPAGEPSHAAGKTRAPWLLPWRATARASTTR